METLVGSKVSGAWAAPRSWLEALGGRCSLEAKASCDLQICTGLGEQDALITFLVSLAKRKHSSLNYRLPDCESLSSLTFQLQICGSCLPAREGLGVPAVVLVQIFLLPSVFNQFCIQLACFFFRFAPSFACSLCFSNFGVKQVGCSFFNLRLLLKGSVCRIMARGNTSVLMLDTF